MSEVSNRRAQRSGLAPAVVLAGLAGLLIVGALLHLTASGSDATPWVAAAALLVAAALTGALVVLLLRMDRYRETGFQSLDDTATRHEVEAVLARRSFGAEEEERARISRELHDGLGQLLAAIRIELGSIERRLAAGSAGAGAEVQSVASTVERAADELRRICAGLRPPLLDDLGLGPALARLAKELQEQSGLAIALDLELDDGGRRLPAEVALCAYRVVQESLSNVIRHAEARGAAVAIAGGPGELVASVQDDGSGFDLDALGATAGSGIAGMRERARLVGGRVEVHSTLGRGTRVVLRVLVDRRVGREGS
jgi:two-component system sensor histidine kinase UhpB